MQEAGRIVPVASVNWDSVDLMIKRLMEALVAKDGVEVPLDMSCPGGSEHGQGSGSVPSKMEPKEATEVPA